MAADTVTYPEELVLAAMASERILEQQRNTERLIDELDAAIHAGLRREFPGVDFSEADDGLIAEARRRLAVENEEQ
jgi:hypothetical protein